MDDNRSLLLLLSSLLMLICNIEGLLNKYCLCVDAAAGKDGQNANAHNIMFWPSLAIAAATSRERRNCRFECTMVNN